MKTMVTLKDTYERVSNSIDNVSGAWDTIHIQYIFSAHDFHGCDTASIIHNCGKI